MIDAELLRVIVYGMGCAGIAIVMFCRSVHMSGPTTWVPIRAGVFLGGCSSVAGLYSLAIGHKPSWPAVLMAVAWLVMLLAASKHWRDGLPAEYSRPAPLDAEPSCARPR